MGADAARALDYAHRRGLVHRDIKPANLLFDEDGQVSVADFGLARALAEATWTEPVGSMLGTARYAAPEQIGGGPLDGKADVYSLALVLVEAVTGKVPFAADTTIGTLMARVDRDVPVPDEMGPLAAAVAAAGVTRPDARSDAAALAVALTSAGRQLPPPGPLTLAAGTDDVEIEEDPDLTELPGRARLFDAERVEQDLPPSRAARPVAGAEARRQSPLPTAGPVGPPPQRAPRRRHRKRWLLILLVILALVGVGVGGLLLRHAATPRHPVPSVVSETPAAATQALAPLHFTLRISSQYDEKVTTGLIISQGAAPSLLLKEGAIVPVVVSLGPPPVTVPDLTGLSQTDATNRLIGAGLKLGAVTARYDNTATKGVVLSWAGQGGQLPKGSTVDLLVSNGPPVVPVPPISGGTFGAAQAALGAVGLTAAESDVFSTTVPKGQVISISPAAGTTVQVGTKVTATVSKGPDLVTVPDVRGLTVDAATNALGAAGFSVSGVNGTPANKVTHTSPAGGAQVLRGSSVALYTT
jgi:serine/threonine-protein kinase